MRHLSLSYVLGDIIELAWLLGKRPCCVFGKFFRHRSDRVILDLVKIEKSTAKQYNMHYIDSYKATNFFLNEKERIKWGKVFSLGRTDRVHFCLPGPVDFATNEVLELLSKKTGSKLEEKTKII